MPLPLPGPPSPVDVAVPFTQRWMNGYVSVVT
jgi:hypothetical protein